MSQRSGNVSGEPAVPFQAVQASKAPLNAPPGLARVPDGIEAAPDQNGDTSCLSTLAALLGCCLAGIFSCLHSICVSLGLISVVQPRAEAPRPVPITLSTQSSLAKLQLFIERWITSPAGPWTREAGKQILAELCALAGDIQEEVRDAIWIENRAAIDAKAEELALSALTEERRGQRDFDPQSQVVRNLAKQRSPRYVDQAVDLFIEAHPLPRSAIDTLNGHVGRLQQRLAILTLD